jgi:hypothetical protein
MVAAGARTPPRPPRLPEALPTGPDASHREAHRHPGAPRPKGASFTWAFVAMVPRVRSHSGVSAHQMPPRSCQESTSVRHKTDQFPGSSPSQVATSSSRLRRTDPATARRAPVGHKNPAERCALCQFRHHRRQPFVHMRHAHPGAVGVRTLSCERSCPPLATFPRGAAPSDMLSRRRGLGNRTTTPPSQEGSADAWSRCDRTSGARSRPASRTLRSWADRRRCRPPAPGTAP